MIVPNDSEWLEEYDDNYLHSDLTHDIINAFYRVYNKLGFGFLEQVYQNALFFELKEEGFDCIPQMPINVYYKGKVVGKFKADIVVDNKIILELKAAKELSSANVRQLYNYLHATQYEVGLLLNFGEKPQIVRRVCPNDD